MATSYLDKTDEEIAAMAAPQFPDEAEVITKDEQVPGEEVVADDDTKVEEVTPESISEEDGNTKLEEETAEGASPLSVSDSELSIPSKQVTTPKDKVLEDINEVVKDEKVVAKEIDFKAEYEKMFKPFKANGKDIEVKSVDDAIALMQMGVNYNKKMAGLKPNLKLMKTLEVNGLLDEDKINYLIDLDKKNPDAINKLIKDSGIDVLDIDTSQESNYRPTAHGLSDNQAELHTVLDDLADSPTWQKTADVVTNKWDSKSKQIVSEAPQILKLIDTHMQSGVYDVILKEVEAERVFGRLENLSDIEAYKQVGDSIQARGGFNHLFTNTSGTSNNSGVNAPTIAKVISPKPVVNDPKLNDKKRAVGSTRTVVSTAKDTFNPLAVSDEEFGKKVLSDYL